MNICFPYIHKVLKDITLLEQEAVAKKNIRLERVYDPGFALGEVLML